MYFEAQDFGLREGERFSVHFDETFASLIFDKSVEMPCCGGGLEV